MASSSITTIVPGWVFAVETASPANDAEGARVVVRIPDGTKFLVAVASSSENLDEPGPGPISIRAESRTIGEAAQDSNTAYVDPSRGVVVFINPVPGRVEVFFPADPRLSKPTHSIFSSYILDSQPSVWKCRTCKLTAKALAAAITVAVLHAVLPAAIVASVASFLGVTMEVATVFVTSLSKSSFDEIVQRLCEMVELC